MLMTRRGFLGTILAAAVAPAIVRADSLMRIVPRDALFLDADMLLRADVVSKLLSVPLVSVGWIAEHVTTIDVTSVLSTEKEVRRGLYEYHARDVVLALPPGARMQALYADGIAVDLANVRIHRSLNGVDSVSIMDMDVTPFGNRIPDFEIEVES